MCSSRTGLYFFYSSVFSFYGIHDPLRSTAAKKSDRDGEQIMGGALPVLETDDPAFVGHPIICERIVSQNHSFVFVLP